jgi:hypothetical protein
MVDVETGEAPRAMRPLAVDPPARSAEQSPRSSTRSDPVKRPVAHRSQQPKPASETLVARRIEPDISDNQRPAAGLPVDEAVRENTFIARPDASTPPFGTGEVLWAEDWQADVSHAAPAGDLDAEPRPWRRGLRG